MIQECIFCHIVACKAPTRVVYRDADIIAFFPQTLNAKGHTLIVPLNHHTDLFQIPDDIAGRIMIAARNIGNHYHNVLRSDGINLLHARGVATQQSIFHFHLCLMLRFVFAGI
jgi:histidine triad (HIT) family protein